MVRKNKNFAQHGHTQSNKTLQILKIQINISHTYFKACCILLIKIQREKIAQHISLEFYETYVTFGCCLKQSLAEVLIR